MKPRAIKAEVERSSSTNEEYHKYTVTYLDEDGFTKVVPAYGRDMQEALRKVSKELKRETRHTFYKRSLAIILVLSIVTAISSVVMALMNI